MKRLIFFFLLISVLGVPVQGQDHKIDSLVKALHGSMLDTSRVITLNTLSWESLNMNRFDTAHYYAMQALSAAQKLSFKTGEIRAYNNLGGIYWNWGKYDEALKNYSTALDLSTRAGEKNLMAIASNNIGLVYWNQGKYSEALKTFFESLKISKQTGDKKALVLAYNNIGIIYFQQGNYEEALKHYLTSISISRETGDKKGLVLANNNVGLIYMEQQKFDQALAAYESSLKISTEMQDKKIMAMAYCNIALVQYRQEKFEESAVNHYKSLELMDEIGTVYGKGINYNSLGRICLNQNKNREARMWLEKAYAISKEAGDYDGIKNCCQSMFTLDSITGNWKDAFDHYKEYIATRDSLINEENTKKSLEAQMEYEYGIKEAKNKAEHDKKEALARAEIGKQKVIRNSIAGGTGILVFSSVISFVFYKRRRDEAFRKKEAELRQQEAELKQQVSEVEMKALRSQMNPHFIFNSLNSIYRYMENHDIERAGSYLVQFSKLIRMILENSMHPEVTLQEDIQGLELYMKMESMRLNDKFDFSFEINEALDPNEILVPPLLLQPFVENAIWHGLSPKEERGHISIRIHPEGDSMIRCEVEDNGVGRDFKKTTESNKLNGHKKSLGMAITKERIELINRKKGTNGYFKIIDLKDGDNKGIGSKVEVFLPLLTDN